MQKHNGNSQGSFLLAIILGALAVLLSDRSEALEQDKQQHVAVSAFLGAVGAVACRETEHPVLYGAALAVIPGLAKEVYDARHPDRHTASTADLAADVVGAAAGAWIGHGLRLGVTRNRTWIGLQVRF
jgi:VanZ family protein